MQLQREVNKVSSSSGRPPDAGKVREVLRLIGILSDAPVDFSVLRSTQAIDTLKGMSRRNDVPRDVKDELKSVLQRWKVDVSR